MPKLVGDVREAALQETKRQLFDRDAGDLNMRTVAKACGIAVGTLYNYFPSKDVMIASVMLEDWVISIQKMQERIDAAENLNSGVLSVYEEIRAFSRTYSKVWHTVHTQTQALTFDRHKMLVEQIEGVLAGLLARLGGTDNGCYRKAAVELLLQQASRMQDESFENLWPALERLLAA